MNRCICIINHMYKISRRGFYRPARVRLFFKRLGNVIPPDNKNALAVFRKMKIHEEENMQVGPPVFEDLSINLCKIIRLVYKVPKNVKIKFPFDPNNPRGKDEREDERGEKKWST